MSQAELLRLIVTVLHDLGIRHMLVGSHASSYYGEPRSTHDIDMVIDLPAEKIAPLISRFDPTRYYLSESALREGRMANLIDTFTGDKVDLFFAGDSATAKAELSRSKPGEIFDVDIKLISPEALILSKGLWSRDIGGSQRQDEDVRLVLRNQKDKLDWNYLEARIRNHDLVDWFERLRQTP